ncbi:MAG: 2-enoyl thioester reductase domain-containing protein [Verrucomicrobiae bacterium]|nr:2-enoyl thioester reductase domain-containing protein [Verrucomicrobiae bacterium]
MPLPEGPRSSLAVVYRRYGPPLEAIEIERQPVPPLEPDQVLVAMRRAMIHPADLNTIEGTYGIPRPPPAVGGGEGVGVIVEVGPGVEAARVGQIVRPPPGAGVWREFFCAAAAEVRPLPEGLTLDQAAGLTVNPSTAWRMLEDFVRLEPGDWIAQNAANSTVGRCVIQIARHRGVRTLNLVRRPGLETELEAIGADAVLAEGAAFARRAKEIAGGRPIRLALNAVGGESAIHLSRALSDGGTLVTYGGMSRQPFTVGAGPMIFKDLRYRGFWVSRWFREAPQERADAMLEELAAWMRAGRLKIPVARHFPLAEARAAVEAALSSGRSGKAMFAIGE